MSEFNVTMRQLENRLYFVHVKQLKFDNVRQETYWATPKGMSKVFGSKDKAERYMTQFI